MTKTIETATKTAYEQAEAYRRSVAGKLQALREEQASLQQQAASVAAEMTTAAGLLSADDKKGATLKEFHADIAAIDQKIKAIEAAGELSGILQQDPRMSELAEAVYAENFAALEGMMAKKEALQSEIRQHLERFREIEARFLNHNAAVEALESEIEDVKQFVSSVNLPQTPYRYRPDKSKPRSGAHLPGPYSFVFSDVRKNLENLRREGL